MKHEVVLWAGLMALFANLTAVFLVNTFGSSTVHKLIGATISSLVIGASVYCKQRWDDAKGKGEVVDVGGERQAPRL